MTNIAANYGTAPETARHRDFRYASGTRPVPCRSCTTQHAYHHGAPACGVWAGPQPSGMPDANRLNATATDHHDGHPKSPFRSMRTTLKPVPPIDPETCCTRMPRPGIHGAESRATSRIPYTGRFCGRRDYLMPTPPATRKKSSTDPGIPLPAHPCLRSTVTTSRRHAKSPLEQAPAPSSPAACTSPGGHPACPGRPPPSRSPAPTLPGFSAVTCPPALR